LTKLINSSAIRRDPGNWIYYEKRIQILDNAGDTELAMRTRLQAAHSVNCQTSQIGFAWIDKQIKTVKYSKNKFELINK